MGAALQKKILQVEAKIKGGEFDWNPLIDRLDAAVEKHGRSAFIKLSTRSPKDSSKAMYGACKTMKDLMDKMGGGITATTKITPFTSIDQNALWVQFSEQLRLGLCVSTGLEALLLLATSVRVKEDLESDLFEQKEGNNTSSEGTIQIITRTFNKQVTPATEFRGFVWGGEFTCCGQYFHQLHFPELVDGESGRQKQQQAEKDLRSFYKTLIKPNIPEFLKECPCFMMDLVWLGGEQDGYEGTRNKCFLTEINPFDGESLGVFPASTGLYLWDKWEDRRIIMGEDILAKPRQSAEVGFELRMRHDPLITAENLKSHPELRNLSPLWKWAIYGE